MNKKSLPSPLSSATSSATPSAPSPSILPGRPPTSAPSPRPSTTTAPSSACQSSATPSKTPAAPTPTSSPTAASRENTSAAAGWWIYFWEKSKTINNERRGLSLSVSFSLRRQIVTRHFLMVAQVDLAIGQGRAVPGLLTKDGDAAKLPMAGGVGFHQNQLA